MTFRISAKRRPSSNSGLPSVQPEPIETAASFMDGDGFTEYSSTNNQLGPIPQIVVHPPPQDGLSTNNVCRPVEALPSMGTAQTPITSKISGVKANPLQKRLGSRRLFQVYLDARKDEDLDSKSAGHPSNLESQRAAELGRDPLKPKTIRECKRRTDDGFAPPKYHGVRPGNALPKASLLDSEQDTPPGSFPNVPKLPGMPTTEPISSAPSIKPTSQSCQPDNSFRGGVARMSISLPKTSKYVLSDVEVPLHYDTLQRWCGFTFGPGVSPPMDTPTVGPATPPHWQGNILSSTEGTGRNALVTNGSRQAYLWGYRELSTPDVKTNLVLVEWAFAIPPQSTLFPSRSSTESAILAIVTNSLTAMCTAGALELGPLNLNRVASNLAVQMRQAVITHILDYQPQNFNL